MKNDCLLLLVAFVATFSINANANPELTIKLNKPRGSYKLNEQIVFDVSIKGVSPEESKKVTYLLKRGGVEEISKGTIDLSTKSYAIKTKLNK